jgi:hypothetical protein
MMRILGSVLIVIGTLLFLNVAMLGATSFHNMTKESQTRFYVAIVVTPLIAATGVWIVRREERR